MIKYTIVYDGEVDRIPAEVISWNYKKEECKVCDIKDNSYFIATIAYLQSMFFKNRSFYK